MDRRSVFSGLSGVLLVWAVALAGCSERVAGGGEDTQVYSLSADGRALVGHVRDASGVETGRVSVPAGSVWSMAGTGEAGLVWVHAPEQTLLVDTRHWRVLTRWSRVSGGDAPMVARGEVP